MLRSADLLSEIREADEYGLKVERRRGRLPGGAGAPREGRDHAHLGASAALFKKNGIDVIEGDGELTADGDVLWTCSTPSP